MEKFVLPERWVVKASNDAEDEIIVKYINETFDTQIRPGLSDNSIWYYSNINHSGNHKKYDYGAFSYFENCKEITFQQFIDYVLNDLVVEDKPYKHDPELEIILKRLLE